MARTDADRVGTQDRGISARLRPEAARPAAWLEPGAPATVLIVEDEPDLRLTLRGLLKRDERFDVVGEAEDGLIGLELATEHQPDVILLDLNMPRMDGREAGPRMFRSCPRSMIVVLSALDATIEAGPAIARGAFAYVEKNQIGTYLSDGLADLLARFRRGLFDEQTVWAPIGEIERDVGTHHDLDEA